MVEAGEGTGHCSVLRTPCLSAPARGHEPADRPDGACGLLPDSESRVPSGSIHSVSCRDISRRAGVPGALSSDLDWRRLSSSASPAGTDGRLSDVSHAVITERSFEQEGKAVRFAVYHNIRRLLQSGPDAVRRIGGTNARRLPGAEWRIVGPAGQTGASKRRDISMRGPDQEDETGPGSDEAGEAGRG